VTFQKPLPSGFFAWAAANNGRYAPMVTYEYQCVNYGGLICRHVPRRGWLMNTNGDACSAGPLMFKRDYAAACMGHDTAYDLARYYKSQGYLLEGKAFIDNWFSGIVYDMCRNKPGSSVLGCSVDKLAASVTLAAPIK